MLDDDDTRSISLVKSPDKVFIKKLQATLQAASLKQEIVLINMHPLHAMAACSWFLNKWAGLENHVDYVNHKLGAGLG